MITYQKTAPAEPTIKFPMIRSTSMEIDIEHIPNAESYKLKIDPEVDEIPSNSSYLTVAVDPETEYTVSLVVVMSKAKDIQTSEVKRTVKTSPRPSKLEINMKVDREGNGIDFTFEGLEKEAKAYRYRITIIR